MHQSKRDWLDQQCLFIEQLNKENKSKSLHREVKTVVKEILKTETKIYSLKNKIS